MLNDRMRFAYFIVLMLVVLFPQLSVGQKGLKKYFTEITITIDTNTFSLNKNSYEENGERKLAFEYRENNPVAVLKFYPNVNDIVDRTFELKRSNEFEIIDSLLLMIDGYYQCKVQFIDLSQSDLLNIYLSTEGKNLAIPLFPFTHTYATIYPGESDFFIGEEKTIPIVSNNEANISVDPKWVQEENYEY